MKWGLSMIEIMAPRPTHTSAAIAIGAAMMVGQLQYPVDTKPYAVPQESATYSAFIDGLVRFDDMDRFAQQMADIYNSFAQRQERLGAEFEAAIFGDIESLYEA